MSCWYGGLSGAKHKWCPIISCFIKIQNGDFLVPTYGGCFGKVATTPCLKKNDSDVVMSDCAFTALTLLV